MRYFGGKARIAKDLSKFVNENYLKGNNKTFVDLFCGSCNILQNIDKDRKIVANDNHKYLMDMWKELQKGWIPPTSCSEEYYLYIKNNQNDKSFLSGFIGFGCSFSGKWWGGYARCNTNRNYCLNAHNSILKKIDKMKDVTFINKEYNDVNISDDSVVYCDIPYQNTTAYCGKTTGEFSHDKFYQWVQENKHNFTILISEYKENVPNGYKIVWEKQSKQDVRSKDGNKKQTIEVLITPII